MNTISAYEESKNATFRRNGSVELNGEAIGTIEKRRGVATGLPIKRGGKLIGWGGRRSYTFWVFTGTDGRNHEGETRRDAVTNFLIEQRRNRS